MVSRRIKLGLAVVGAAVALILLAIGSVVIYQYMFVPVWTEEIPVLNATDQNVVITEYRNATNTTYANLTVFLESDHTENIMYVNPTYTCSDFAVALHNSAEAHGIKCGVVSVQFEGQSIGHMFDVFPTDDKGLVYVDATGVNETQRLENITPIKAAVYLEDGRELGEIAFSQTGGDLDYGFYTSRQQQMDLYKQDVAAYIADYDQYELDYKAWNASVTQLAAEYDNYSADLDAYNPVLESYNAQMKAHNDAVAQYNAGNYGVSIPPVPGGIDEIQAWKNRLDAAYITLGNRANDLKREGTALKDRSDALNARYDELRSREEASWIAYNPDGIVSLIDVYW
jgi:uncharacterized protein YpmS